MKFTIGGQVRGKGRPRFRRCKNFVMTYNDKNTKEYEELITESFISQNPSKKPYNTARALALTVTAFYAVPVSFPLKKRELALQCKLRPLVKPDADNVIKIVCDALNGWAYYDDKQIVEIIFKKFYGAIPCVNVEIIDVTSDQRIDGNGD